MLIALSKSWRRRTCKGCRKRSNRAKKLTEFKRIFTISHKHTTKRVFNFVLIKTLAAIEINGTI